MRKSLLGIIVLLLTCLFAPLALADSGQLAYNGDFSELDEETGLPAGWFVEGWLTGANQMLINLDAIDGKDCVHIVNYVENDARLCQVIEVEPDSYYTLSCDVMAKNAYFGGGANISAADTLAMSSPAISDDGWQRLMLTGKTAKDQESLKVAVRLGGYGQLSEGEAWFRNFSLTRLEHEPIGKAADFSPVQAGQTNEKPDIPSIPILILIVLASAALFLIVYMKGVRTAERMEDKKRRRRLI